MHGCRKHIPSLGGGLGRGCYQLSTINYQLSTINYQLSTINYQLSTINYQLSTINYQLSTFNFQLNKPPLASVRLNEVSPTAAASPYKGRRFVEYVCMVSAPYPRGRVESQAESYARRLEIRVGTCRLKNNNILSTN